MAGTSCNTNLNQKLDPVFKGDDKYINLSFKDEDGVAIDLTGSTLVLTIKNKKSDTGTIHTETQTDVDFLDPINGLVQFLISDTVTSGWDAPRTVWYDILWTNASGDDYTFLAGTFDVLDTVH